MRKALVFILGLCLLLVAFWALRMSDTTQALPRYDWEPGAKYVYSMRDVFYRESGPDREPVTTHGRYTLTFWVAQETDDGGHLVFFHIEGASKDHYSKSRANRQWNDWEDWGRFELRPNGEILNSWPPHSRFASCCLPYMPDATDTVRTFQSDDGKISGTVQPPTFHGTLRRRTQFSLKNVLMREPRHTYEYETEAVWRNRWNAPERVTHTYRNSDEPSSHGNRTYRLRSQGRMSGRERDRLLPELERYLTAFETHMNNRQTREHNRPFVYEPFAYARWRDSFETTIAPVQAAWRQTRHPQFKELLERIVKQHDHARKYLDTTQARLELIGQPAPAWTLTDVHGREHSLEAYRGQVVVLDFRHSWMEQRDDSHLHEIKKQFDDSPVVRITLYLNRIVNEEKAQQELDDAGITWPVLGIKDNEDQKNIMDAYVIDHWMPRIVIDGNGMVRAYETGYSDREKEHILSVIRQCLAEAQSTASEQVLHP